MTDPPAARIQVVDSHTGGEPTRVVVSGGPDLGCGTAAEKRDRLQSCHDWFRSAVSCEPRGSDVLVGALITEPCDSTCAAGVVFFNNVGYLGMCGHGMIGLITTLAHLGRIGPGEHRIETPVGVVSATLEPSGQVSIRNVPSYRLYKDIEVQVESYGVVTGDVAWGGNWFFLTAHRSHDPKLELKLENVGALTEFAWRIRTALERSGATGDDGAAIDHIELFSASPTPDADSRNFVLCPGMAYDRSPCGTGTSAKLACLWKDGKLREGEVWRQESIIGSIFEGSISVVGGDLIPTIRGAAYVNAEAALILDPCDPFRYGIGG